VKEQGDAKMTVSTTRQSPSRNCTQGYQGGADLCRRESARLPDVRGVFTVTATHDRFVRCARTQAYFWLLRLYRETPNRCHLGRGEEGILRPAVNFKSTG